MTIKPLQSINFLTFRMAPANCSKPVSLLSLARANRRTSGKPASGITQHAEVRETSQIQLILRARSKFPEHNSVGSGRRCEPTAFQIVHSNSLPAGTHQRKLTELSVFYSAQLGIEEPALLSEKNLAGPTRYRQIAAFHRVLPSFDGNRTILDRPTRCGSARSTDPAVFVDFQDREFAREVMNPNAIKLVHSFSQ